jgi:transcriptional regulator with XRE-family HTH domain
MERHAYVEIGHRLRLLRVALEDESQADFARRHGFKRSQLNNWETGARRIPLEAAITLCDAYGLSLDWIYRGKRDGLPEHLRRML